MIIDSPISLGELVDKISILRIKLKNISDSKKLHNISKEESLLSEKLTKLNLVNITGHLEDLLKVNSKLWKIEDTIREKEQASEFDEEFIELARNVYITNDQRFLIKNKINQNYNSDLVEEKSYQKYVTE